MPYFKQGYSILFGTYQFFVLLKKVATAYERLVKAKQLITDKVREDLDVSNNIKRNIKETFSTEDKSSEDSAGDSKDSKKG